MLVQYIKKYLLLYFWLAQQPVALCPVQVKLFREKVDQLERVQRRAEKMVSCLGKKKQERKIEEIGVAQSKEKKAN